MMNHVAKPCCGKLIWPLIAAAIILSGWGASLSAQTKRLRAAQVSPLQQLESTQPSEWIEVPGARPRTPVHDALFEEMFPLYQWSPLNGSEIPPSGSELPIPSERKPQLEQTGNADTAAPRPLPPSPELGRVPETADGSVTSESSQTDSSVRQASAMEGPAPIVQPILLPTPSANHPASPPAAPTPPGPLKDPEEPKTESPSP
ncbi:MAG: hypothetical protein KDA80_14790, partial [Planctomycetaceae bacterium]|nr:hypothetical protein [Planctomycetaceae bacterium]